MATRTGHLMHKLVSPQQVAYVNGRCIQDQIMLASEMVNEMVKKRRCGNVGLKLDISQAYDSSARISVMVDGGPCGFFSVGRGLRKGDPLSHILFVLLEEALSRRLTQMVEAGLIFPMVVRKGIRPTHLLFADDVFIFCNDAKKRILNLMKFLEDYQKSSGQIINKHKSKMFIDGGAELRKSQLKQMIQMEKTVFPDKYLGVILYVGRVKVSTVWPMVELMQKKLATLKGLKWAWEALKEDVRWRIGDGKQIYVWFDNWIEEGTLIDKIGYTSFVNDNIHLKISDIIADGVWYLPTELQQTISNGQLPEICGGADVLIWTRNLKRKFSMPEALNKIRDKEQENKKFFDNIKPNAKAFKCRILKLVNEGGLRMTGTKWNQTYDNEIITRFDLGPRYSKFQVIKRFQWSPPEIGFVMFCCNGSSFGNPGAAGFGIVVRNLDCQVVATLSGGIGIASNYLAETYGVINAMELAVQWELQNIIIVSDSKTVIVEFIQGNVPWFIKGRWLKAIKQFKQIKYMQLQGGQFLC
ncbi:uncharacterized protein LOC113326516 [Papaver somniferum]|uniref:uncharacterized protein LOC113326516 n=1 Tax=Papaver somniferum TaxID=3469 RepID=UPI000E6FAC90|nr:uncharacterized protein LOC113326516 [Papaver somniferum]